MKNSKYDSKCGRTFMAKYDYKTGTEGVLYYKDYVVT